MRTTIDLPDPLYRTLKARAALSGMTLRELVQRLIEQALSQADASEAGIRNTKPDPPIAIPATGVTIPALSAEDLGRLEEEEDLERLARSS